MRNVVIALQNQGMSLALMNIALTMLAVDLLVHELKTSALPLFGLDSEKVHLVFIVVVFPGLNP